MSLHIAVASPLNVARLASEFDLHPAQGRPVPEGHGGHPVTEIVVAMRGMVDRLDLVTLDPSIAQPVELVGEGVRVAVGPFRPRPRTRVKDLFAAERGFIADRLREWQPEVVSAHWTYEYALGSLDSALPTLVTVHDWAPTIFRYQPDRYRAARWFMQRLTFHRGSHFAAVSPYMAALVERLVDDEVSILPNALSQVWFESAAGSEMRSRRVLAVNSGFGKRKNVQGLLRAWPLVLDAVPDAQLTLVGEGYEMSGPAHRWSCTAGLDSRVEFLGPQARLSVAESLRRSAVFVHPSREESFGMVVLEAMASSTPVIGGLQSGAVPWLLEGEAGVLVDIESPDQIAGAVISLLMNPSEARTIGERGRARAQSEFTSGPLAGHYIDELGRLRAKL